MALFAEQVPEHDWVIGVGPVGEAEERLLDEAVQETFPASDPIAVADVTETPDDSA